MHPLIGNLESLKDSDVQNKINELTKKYFLTANIQLRSQIATILDVYREELSMRRSRELQKGLEDRNKDLDSLIKTR